MNPGRDANLIVYFGGQFVPLAEARVGILTHAPITAQPSLKAFARIGKPPPDPLPSALRQLYVEAAHGHLPAGRKWLLPVYQARQESPQGAVHLAGTSVA